MKHVYIEVSKKLPSVQDEIITQFNDSLPSMDKIRKDVQVLMKGWQDEHLDGKKIPQDKGVCCSYSINSK